ncbi:MAG TPA: SAM-dependent methyltransferase [Chloroflexota bacterium]|nr:SAM-dependent methyltransferase [Chloroflexota bacterium]
MSVREKIQSGVFRAVQIAGLPVIVVAYLLFVLKMIGFSRRTGVSASILASFYPRWMMHQLGTRRDDPCVRLMRVLPNVSQLGLRLLTGPTLLAHRLTGHVPKIYRYPYPGVPPMKDQPAARTTFFDEALARHLADVDQLVILGAGLDTRSYRLPAGSSIRCFEVDTPWTQPFKRAMLKKAGIDTARVTFVPADFEREDWFEKIVAAGFDPSKPTFFLWEAVTMYLDREAVENTLRKVAGTVPGSAVAFDYFSREQLGDQSAIWRYGRAVLKAVGEPMGTFSIDSTPPVRDRVAAFLASCGLSLEEQRNFGQETARERARAGFATATV